MKALPTQQRALAKRNALICAAEHCFAKLGYEGCTAKIVAEHAEVATGTFYQYFDNKDDMLHTLAEQWFFELEHTLDDHQSSPPTTDIEARLENSLRFIYDFHEQKPELHQIFEHRRNVDGTLADILNRGEAKLQQHVAQFVHALKLPNADLVAYNLFAMAEGVVHRHVFYSETKQDKDAVIQQAARMLASYLHHPS